MHLLEILEKIIILKHLTRIVRHRVTIILVVLLEMKMELLLNKRVQMNFRIVVMIVEELKENVEE